MEEPHRLRHAPNAASFALGQLAEAQMVLVAVCRRRKHRKVIYVPALIERHGPDHVALDLRPKFR